MLGLDIGSSSVKLVELVDAGGGALRLERYAIEPIPRGAVVDGNLDKIDVVADAVKRVWRRSGTRIKNVAMALPASAVITKRIALPGNLREEEMEMQVESEANQYIPFALDEVSLDFQVLGPIPNAPDDVEVLIAASRKEKVEDRMAVAQAAGLVPIVVDVESFAARAALGRLVEQLPNHGEGLVIAVFYIGANTTSVTVLLDGEAIYEREQPFGGQQLTGDIARAYGISAEDAEQKKRNGDLPANYEAEVLKPFIHSTTTEITRALQFFFTSTPLHPRRPDHARGRLLGPDRAARGADGPRAGPDLGHFALQGDGTGLQPARTPAPAGRARPADALRPGDAEIRQMTVRVNLLPHREARRKRQKNAFFFLTGMSVLAGAALVLVVWSCWKATWPTRGSATS